MSTQPPYHTSTFGAPNQDPSASTPIGTQVGAAPQTDPMTGPAPSTAGPHQSNMGNQLDPRVDSGLNSQGQHAAGTAHHSAHNQGYNQSSNAGPHNSFMMNKVDPRVDSDMDNCAQYAPGTTAAGNAHPGTVQDSSYGHGAHDGPHRSSMMNKADPRVDAQTGETSTRTTNQTGADTSSYPAGAGYGSTAGHAPTQSHAAPEHEAQYVPHGEQRESGGTATGSSATGSKSARKGEDLGHNVKSLFAGVHGAGESLRGGLTAAVDKAFGHDEGAAKNAEIANKGERQIQTGQFGRNAH